MSKRLEIITENSVYKLWVTDDPLFPLEAEFSSGVTLSTAPCCFDDVKLVNKIEEIQRKYETRDTNN